MKIISYRFCVHVKYVLLINVFFFQMYFNNNNKPALLESTYIFIAKEPIYQNNYIIKIRQ